MAVEVRAGQLSAGSPQVYGWRYQAFLVRPAPCYAPCASSTPPRPSIPPAEPSRSLRSGAVARHKSSHILQAPPRSQARA